MSLLAVEIVVELLVIATIVAVLAKSFRIPYTVFLVLAGLILSLMKGLNIEFLEPLGEISLSKDLILLIFLPPLLFEGTINMELEILRRRLWHVVLLAIPGTLLTTCILGLSLSWSFGLGLAGAFLIGSMLAPTDPVSVIALFKEQGVNKDLSTLVEGESVFNDGIGVVLFLIFLKMVQPDGHITLLHGLGEFLWEILVGGSAGIALGYTAHWVLGRINDRFTEVMISVALAYGAYIVAEHLNASGVIAVVAAGLIIGNYGRMFAMSPTTRLALSNFWEVASFLVNSILFLLMGIASDLGQIVAHWEFILAGYLILLTGRSLSVYGFSALLTYAGKPLPLNWQHVMNWGGLKGSIPIALVLGLPPELLIEAGGQQLDKHILTQIIFGVVLISLLLQGLTIGPLLKKLGFGEMSLHEREFELLRGRTISLKSAREALEELSSSGEVSNHNYKEIRKEIDRELKTLTKSMQTHLHQHRDLNDSEFQRVAHALLLSQKVALEDAFRQGLLSEEAMEMLVEDLDTKLADEEGSPFYTPEEIDAIPDLEESREQMDEDSVERMEEQAKQEMQEAQQQMEEAEERMEKIQHHSSAASPEAQADSEEEPGAQEKHEPAPEETQTEAPEESDPQSKDRPEA